MERFRGAPLARPGAVAGALPPPSACPSGAIATGAGQAGYSIDLARCLFCGRCAKGPPESAIGLGWKVELAVRRRESLVVQVGTADGGRAVALPSPPPAAQVADRIQRTLGRSLHLRHLDSGSCNARDWELAALLNPVFDVRRLGVDFVASPRHADGVIVTGL